MTSVGGIFGFVYFFVHLLRALPTFFIGKLLLFLSYKIFSKLNTLFFSDRMNLKTC